MYVQEQCPIIYSNLLYKMGHYLSDILYSESQGFAIFCRHDKDSPDHCSEDGAGSLVLQPPQDHVLPRSNCTHVLCDYLNQCTDNTMSYLYVHHYYSWPEQEVDQVLLTVAQFSVQVAAILGNFFIQKRTLLSTVSRLMCACLLPRQYAFTFSRKIG